MTCIHCGRERKKSMARSDRFCTQRCILQWLEANPDKTLQDAITDDVAPPAATAAAPCKLQPTHSFKYLYLTLACFASLSPPCRPLSFPPYPRPSLLFLFLPLSLPLSFPPYPLLSSLSLSLPTCLLLSLPPSLPLHTLSKGDFAWRMYFTLLP